MVEIGDRLQLQGLAFGEGLRVLISFEDHVGG